MKFIADITVLGFTPVPWTVPHFGSGTSKSGKRFHFQSRTRKSRPENFSPDLERWQELIRNEARNDRNARGNSVVSCPVMIMIEFTERTPPGKKHDELWFPGVKKNAKGKWVKSGNHEPDLTNLVKAVEDALQGVVYHNDFQVRQHDATMIYGETPGINILVQEIEDSDFPGWGETVESPKPRTRKRNVAIQDRQDQGQS